MGTELLDVAQDVAPVEQAGERIRMGLAHAFGVGAAQTIAITMIARLDLDPRQKLGRVGRLHQIVVDAEFERLRQAGDVALIGQKEHGTEPRRFIGAQLRGDAQRVVPGQIEIKNDDIGRRGCDSGDEIGLTLRGNRRRDQLVRQGRAHLGGVGDIIGHDADLEPIHEIGVIKGRGTGFDAELARGLFAQLQLVQHHFQPQQRAEAGEQRLVLDRLGEEIIGAGLEPAHPVLLLAQGGDHDDRNMGGLGRLPEPTADLEAVHARHHDVEQHDVGALGLHLVERFLAALGGDDLVILGSQFRLEQANIDENVIDH